MAREVADRRRGDLGMTVYVDNARRRFGRMIMCHMLADSETELHRMAAAIGLRREWFQRDHYDLSLTRKEDAIRRGAVEVTSRAMVGIRRRYRVRVAGTRLAKEVWCLGIKAGASS